MKMDYIKTEIVKCCLGEIKIMKLLHFFFKVENEEYNILFNVYYQTKALYFLLSKYKLLIFVCFCSLFVVFCRLCGSVPLMDFLNVSGNILSFAPKHLSFFFKNNNFYLQFFSRFVSAGIRNKCNGGVTSLITQQPFLTVS